MGNFVTIVNTDTNTMIHAVCRCGTNRLTHVSRFVKGWKAVSYEHIKRYNYTELSHIKIIRDPYQRWRSWFYDFEAGVTDPNWTKKWNLDYAKLWVEDFKDEMHYNMHTGLQKILYKTPYTAENEIFLAMEDIDIFLGLSEKRHDSDTRKLREEKLPADVISYLQIKIPFLYNTDYAWMQNLPVWGK